MNYDRRTALALAVASKMAYGDGCGSIPESVKYLDKTLSEIKLIEIGTAEVLFIRGKNTTIIAFRGSDEKGDWIKNLTVAKKKMRYGSVMKGFDDEMSKLWVKCLVEYDNSHSIYVTGHSKGGGEGVCFLNRLIAARIGGQVILNSGKLKAAYFFGCPRSLGKDTADSFTNIYNNRVFRVENNNDIVCRVPSQLRFKHVCPENRIYISRSGKIMHGNIPYATLAYDRVMGRIESWKKGIKFDGLSDHAPIGSRYIKPFHEG